ncbi:MAG TPA: 16S rRNA (adenine(1518)-N(6)/adenine(1519)-N(6))-dimethyltransferase RsmA [Anaerolineales bacterium]|nr:16S rRNA (adenine(1518)-N(6)/adenine(1519)-N(6))-dimethyltransferase RsmA [Anaerolineales bacterium]
MEKSEIGALLKKYGLRPRKGLGQNFLAGPEILQKIVDAAGVGPGDVVLEVGPGLGGLTLALAAAARRVVAVEIDRELFGPLEEVLSGAENVRLVQADILAVDPRELIDADEPYLVVANIPYYITSAIFRHLLENAHPPRRLVLTVQKEVAARICAAPPDMNLLGLSVGVYGRPETVLRIPAGAFYPPPKVDSSVVRVDLHAEPRFPPETRELFFRLVRAGFSQKRKTLRNSLSAGMAWSKERAEEVLAAAGIDPMRRAETLDFDEWGKILEIVGG